MSGESPFAAPDGAVGVVATTPGAAPALPPPAALVEFTTLCEPRLRAFLDEKRAAARALPVDLWPAFAATRDYVLRGGKRLRGALVLLGCEAAGGDRAAALPAALGIELFHAYLLVHDDFMDRDEVRRGGPTLHVQLARKGALDAHGTMVPAGEHLGGALAILFGSLLQAWALELVLAAPAAPGRRLEAAQLLTRALAEVTVGQALDLAAPLGPPPGLAETLEIERLKTGSYTFELPLLLGAHLAGAGPQLAGVLSRYARPLGQAFQIADDLLGTFGAPAVTGKSAGSDLREGKRTLLVLRALELASPADRAALLRDLGRRDLTDREVEGLRLLLSRCGAEGAARAEAERLCAEALAALDAAGLPPAVDRALREIAVYTVGRAS